MTGTVRATLPGARADMTLPEYLSGQIKVEERRAAAPPCSTAIFGQLVLLLSPPPPLSPPPLSPPTPQPVGVKLRTSLERYVRAPPPPNMRYASLNRVCPYWVVAVA